MGQGVLSRGDMGAVRVCPRVAQHLFFAQQLSGPGFVPLCQRAQLVREATSRFYILL